MTDGSARSQVRGSSLLLSGQALALVMNMAAQVVLVRYLTKTDFGAFAYALSVAIFCETLVGFGMRRAVGRFLPLYEERGDHGRALGTLLLATGVMLGLGAAVTLTVVGLRDLIAGDVAPGAETALLLSILILLAPLTALGTLLDVIFGAFGDPRTIVLRSHLLVPGLRLAVVLLAVLAGGGSVAVAVGYVATGVVALLVFGWLLRRVLAQRHLLAPLRERGVVVPSREIMTFTLPLLAAELTWALRIGAAAVPVGLLSTALEVAELRAVLPVAMTLTYVQSAFGLLFAPMAVRLLERGTPRELNSMYWQTAGYSAVLTLPVLLVGVVFAEPLTVLLFGEEYAGAGVVLAVLVLGQFSSLAVGPNVLLLMSSGLARSVLVAELWSVAVWLGLIVALVPGEGALGAAVATTASILTVNVICQLVVHRRTPVRAIDPQGAMTIAAIAGATLAVAGLHALLGLPLWAGVAVSLAVSGAVLYASRRRLAFAETFPELAPLPGLRRLLG